MTGRQRISLAFIGAAIVAVLTWSLGWWKPVSRPVPQNSIMVIVPYRHQGTWVFDDPNAGLVREPFVAGVPEMIDHLVTDIPNAKTGFRLLFSARPFPGHQEKLTWTRADEGSDGNYYRLDDPPMEGWLCPALFKYFNEAPAELYVKAEAIERD
jgi:hypothetical protein